MESQSPQIDRPALYASAPAFADAAMAAHFAAQAVVPRLWNRFGWWLHGSKILRDLPDYRPAISFGMAKPPETLTDCLLCPTLLIVCTACPAPVSADDGMDFIKGYAAGCEVHLPAAAPQKSALPLWRQDTAARLLISGDMASIDDIEDPYCRDISVSCGNELIAKGNTDDLTWSVADLVAAASAIMPLPEEFIISCGVGVKTTDGRQMMMPAARNNMMMEVAGLPRLPLNH